MNLETARVHYFAEIDRRSRLEREITFPATLLILLASVSVWFLKEWRKINSDYCDPIFVVWLGGSILWMVALLFMVRALVGYRYSEVPIGQQYDYWLELQSYYRNRSVDALVREKFSERLAGCYAEATQLNAKQNQRRSAALYWAKVSLILATLPQVFAGLLLL